MLWLLRVGGAWGNNANGQLGNWTGKTNNSLPVLVSGLPRIIAISAGNDTSLALAANGAVWGWGMNNTGSLCYSVGGSQTTPVSAYGLSNIKMLSTSGDHSLFVQAGGTVWGCGNDSVGQLGDQHYGAGVQSYTPVQAYGLTGAVAVAAGFTHSLAVKANGTVWAWGDNTYGELGFGSTGGFSPQPASVPGLSGIV